MKNVIILHGRPSKEQFEDPSFPSPSNYYWLPWLQKKLSLIGIPTQTPEVPNAYIPDYKTWLSVFEQQDINKDTVLVGHSCGGGFIVRWLSEHKEISVGKVILVAPWIDLAGDPDNEFTKDFLSFELDKDFVSRTDGVLIINSSDDVGTIQRSVEQLREVVNDIKYLELSHRGHFYDDQNMEFPELFKEIQHAS
jgi:predicted alpha/beta hydrolase family esterase